jgi:hypothetical protein
MPPRRELTYDEIMRGAKAPLAEGTPWGEGLSHWTPEPEPEQAEPESFWGKVKRWGNVSPLPDDLGDRVIAHSAKERDTNALAGKPFSVSDKLGAFFEPTGKFVGDTVRSIATPLGLATLPVRAESTGARLALGAGSAMYGAMGAETALDSDKSWTERAVGGLGALLGGLGVRGAVKGPLPVNRPVVKEGFSRPYKDIDQYNTETPPPSPPPSTPPPTRMPTDLWDTPEYRNPTAQVPSPDLPPPGPQSITPEAWGDWGGAEKELPTLIPDAAGSHVAAPTVPDLGTNVPNVRTKPHFTAEEVAGALKGREKFNKLNPNADLAPGMRDELDRSGIEFRRTNAELKRLLGMGDEADPRELARMKQGKAEQGSRLQLGGKLFKPETPFVQDLPPFSNIEQPVVPPGREGHFTLPEPRAKLTDAQFADVERRIKGREGAPQRRVTDRSAAEPMPEDLGQARGGDDIRTADLSPKFQREFGGLGNERGEVDPRLLANLLRVPAGAAAGAYFDEEDPMRGAAIGGGLAGATFIPGAAKLAERARYFSMLTGQAQAKNVIGNIGVAGHTAAERALTHGAKAGGKVLKEFFSPETLRDTGRAWRERKMAPARLDSPEQMDVTGKSPLLYPFRAMGAIDEAAQNALRRAGVEDAAERTFTSEPTTALSQGVRSFQRSGPLARLLSPFVKTALNVAEAGILPVRDVAKIIAGSSALDQAGKKQALAKLLLLGAGSGAGAAFGATDFAKKHSRIAPFAAVAAGPTALPFAVAQQFSGALSEDKTRAQGLRAAFDALQDQLPLPSESALNPADVLASTVVPSGVKMLNEEFIDTTPRDTTHSPFDPLLSRLPGVSKLLPAKSKRASRAKRAGRRR